MTERFISEEIKPVPAALELSSRPGEPALPRRFLWDGDEVTISLVHRTWKTTSACTHGSGERYVRRHWYEIETEDGIRMILYFDRKPASSRQTRKRWWLFSIDED